MSSTETISTVGGFGTRWDFKLGQVALEVH